MGLAFKKPGSSWRVGNCTSRPGLGQRQRRAARALATRVLSPWGGVVGKVGRGVVSRLQPPSHPRPWALLPLGEQPRFLWKNQCVHR